MWVCDLALPRASPQMDALRQRQEEFEAAVGAPAHDGTLDAWERYLAWAEQHPPGLPLIAGGGMPELLGRAVRSL
jgi:hypothetical protein